MPDEPQIKTLSYEKRKRFFLVLVLVFCLVLPALMFHTTGYRLDFDNDEQTIVSTGGMYITTDNLEIEVFLDDEQVERPRLFRRAYYIQNITAGVHKVVVQGEGLHTWVKDLPVDPYLVVEVAAFNLPTIPRVRPITEYVTATGTAVYVGSASTSTLFDSVTTTVPMLFMNRVRSTQTVQNDEFLYVESLFSSSSTSTRSVFDEILDGVSRFGFATTTISSMATSATTSNHIEAGDLRLFERSNELYVAWRGSDGTIPYYFCVNNNSTSTIAKRYGIHVAEAIEQYRISTTTPLIAEDNRLCRPEIRIDRKHQDVYFYDFFPRNRDLVLLQLDSGLFVTEIDDRAWQNTQLLYPGEDLQVVVENETIYVKDDGYYFEVLTEIEEVE